VNKVVADDEFDDAVRTWAHRLAAKSPLLTKLGKAAVNATRDLDLDHALDFLQAQLALAFTTEDLAEGVRAFREKREPRWVRR
jgi:enoyl-CoA hydratase/carnithine racemase